MVPLAWATRLLVTELGGGVGDGARIVEFCCGVSEDDPPPPHPLIPNKNRLTMRIFFLHFYNFYSVIKHYQNS